MVTPKSLIITMRYGRVVVMLGRNLEFLFFSCVLSFFTTTTFLQLSHFSQELPSGFQQRGSNFLDLPAPLPAPSVSPESLIQFRRLRSFAKQLLWDQQLPNSINRASVNLHIAITATGSLDKLVFPVSSANATVCSACTIQGSMQRHRIWPVSFFCHSSGVPRHRDHLVLRSCFWIQLGVCHSSVHQLHLRMRKNSFNFLSQSHLWESRENLMWGWKPDTKMCFPKMNSYYMTIQTAQIVEIDVLSVSFYHTEQLKISQGRRSSKTNIAQGGCIGFDHLLQNSVGLPVPCTATASQKHGSAQTTRTATGEAIVTHLWSHVIQGRNLCCPKENHQGLPHMR